MVLLEKYNQLLLLGVLMVSTRLTRVVSQLIILQQVSLVSLLVFSI
jgi:hypothetical protein